MGNLGAYQTMTTLAKKCKGPLGLAGVVAVSGYLVLRTGEAGIKKGVKVIKKLSSKNKAVISEYSIKKNGVSNEGLELKKGDLIRVLEKAEDAVLIELVGDEDSPYFVDAKFLKEISDYEEV